MSAPNETYEGVGFSGRCLGDVTLPRPIDKSRAPEEEDNTPQGTGAEGSAGGRAASVAAIAGVLGAFALLALMLFYVQGAFDQLLYDVGLNWESCGLGISGGDVLCGDELSTDVKPVGDSIKAGVASWLP